MITQLFEKIIGYLGTVVLSFNHKYITNIFKLKIHWVMKYQALFLFQNILNYFLILYHLK